MNKDNIVGNSITGGLNPFSDKADIHADLYYEEIRHMNTDCERIVENTSFTMEQVLMIKHYLFLDEHNIDGVVRRFDSTFQIAESWRRLAFDKTNIQPHDLILLNHELLEMSYLNQGYSQQEAHSLANEKYDYHSASIQYYEEMGFDITMFKSLTSGAISFGYNTH